MSEGELPENVKRFIFEFIDSVELLDVLLLMSADRHQFWNAEMLSRELRTNANSIQNRLLKLTQLGLVKEDKSSEQNYYYAPDNSKTEKLIQELMIFNSTMRHRLLQLIFSPMKQARFIADGFRIHNKKSEEEE